MIGTRGELSSRGLAFGCHRSMLFPGKFRGFWHAIMEDAMLGRSFIVLIVSAVGFLCGCSGAGVPVAGDGALTAAARMPADDAHFSLPPAVSPDTEAVEPRPVTAAERFDAALARLAKNEHIDDTFSALAPEERTLISTVVDAITGFRNALADPNALMATRTAPLVALSQQLDGQLPLEIPTLSVCRSVQQFGMYEPIDPPKIALGQGTAVIVYCELSHFRSRLAGDAKWETKLSYEAALYRDDGDEPLVSKKPTLVIDHCRNRRRDFFLADRMTLPSTLPAGKYLLKVTVIDQLANHVAEKSAAVLITAAE
jgi:hypothetical protein